MQEATIPLEVRAGDVTIHHCLTLHGSGNNTSARPRKTIITHLFSGDCRLVSERLPRGARHQFTDGKGISPRRRSPTLFPPMGPQGDSATRAEIS